MATVIAVRCHSDEDIFQQLEDEIAQLCCTDEEKEEPTHQGEPDRNLLLENCARMEAQRELFRRTVSPHADVCD
jgi:hypothetical protein